MEEKYAMFAPDDWNTENAPGTTEESSAPVPEHVAALEPDLRYGNEQHGNLHLRGRA